MLKHIFSGLLNFLKKHYILSGIIVLAVAGGYSIFKPKAAVYQFIEVKKGIITQEVEVTGRVAPVDDLSLAFQGTGRVARVGHAVGERVFAGEALVVLEQGDLLAQLAQAKAVAAAEQARLDDLKAGTRPEELAIKQTAVLQAEKDVNDSYANVLPALEGAYITSNDAVRKQVGDLFIQPESLSPQLTFSTLDSQAQIDVPNKRALAGNELNVWRTELNALYVFSTRDALDSALVSAASHLGVLRDFLTKTNDALNKTVNPSAASIVAFKAEVTTAGTQVATAITNINSAAQNIAGKGLSLKVAQNNLNLSLAGATKPAIEAEQATVDAANANVQNIQAQLAKTILRAPINGIVTKQDAKVGQIVSPNVELVGLISEDHFEIDANIPEVDVGKMAVGNTVKIKLDALQGEIFSGKVFFIDPAETILDGAVNFKTKIAFDISDQRIKSGFTANLNIITLSKADVLTLPQFAILQNDQGIFVRKLYGSKTEDVPITTGIRSLDGTVEIISGVSEGEQVLNIGLKTGA